MPVMTVGDELFVRCPLHSVIFNLIKFINKSFCNELNKYYFDIIYIYNIFFF